jgi:hypothetical protein
MISNMAVIVVKPPITINIKASVNSSSPSPRLQSNPVALTNEQPEILAQN